MNFITSNKEKIIKILKKTKKSTRNFFYLVWFKVASIFHLVAIYKLRNKCNKGYIVKVAFLVADKSIWKSDLVYKRLVSDENYEPFIVVVPRLNAIDIMDNYNETVSFFRKKEYRIVNTLISGKWQKISNVCEMDILFLSSPYALSFSQYTMVGLWNKLTCYIPYFEIISKDYQVHFNEITENLSWKIFHINDIHHNIAKIHSANKGANISVVGFPASEGIYKSQMLFNDINSTPNNKIKKIIIAPHHTIDGKNLLSSSTFLQYNECFIEMAKKYRNEAVFFFKPHPYLKEKLYLNKDWGKRKTDEYWDFWRNQRNCYLEINDYEKLFIESDGLIHDCSSFLVEYLYTGKPTLYLNPNVEEMFNDYGKLAYRSVFKATSALDIKLFIQKLIEGKYNDYLPLDISEDITWKIKKGESPSEHICSELNLLLFKK